MDVLEKMLAPFEEDSAAGEEKQTKNRRSQGTIDEDGLHKTSGSQRIKKKKPLFGSYESVRCRSKKGIHDTFLYRIGEENCYKFHLNRKNKDHLVLACTGCQKKQKDGVKKNVAIKMIDEKFVEDPASLDHICEQLNYYEQLGSSEAFTLVQNIRTTVNMEGTPLELYERALSDILSDETRTVEEREKLAKAYGTYKKHRNAFSRAANSKTGTKMELEEILKKLLSEPGASSDDFSAQDDIFYSKVLLEEFVQSDITHFILDGWYGTPLADSPGHLLTVHALNREERHFPVFHAIIRHKDEATYERIFRKLKELIEAGCDLARVKWVLDFDTAATAKIKEIFPKSGIESCGFLLATVLESRSKSEGLQDVFPNYPEIKSWYMKLIALPFIPEDLVAESKILESPVHSSHEAFEVCQRFLNYFLELWNSPQNTYLRHKFFQPTNRLTNIVEFYHLKLSSTLKQKTPPTLENIISEIKNALENDLSTIQNQKVQDIIALKARNMDLQRKVDLDAKMIELYDLREAKEPTPEELSEYALKTAKIVMRQTVSLKEPTSENKMPSFQGFRGTRYKLHSKHGFWPHGFAIQ